MANKNDKISIPGFLAKCQFGMGVSKIKKNPKPGRQWVNVTTTGVFFGDTRDQVRTLAKESKGATNEPVEQVA